MKNNELLQAMALDLKRCALGYHSGSIKMGDRFLLEVLKRKKQLDTTKLPDYLLHILNSLTDLRAQSNIQAFAERTLMYSTIFLNYAK